MGKKDGTKSPLTRSSDGSFVNTKLTGAPAPTASLASPATASSSSNGSKKHKVNHGDVLYPGAPVMSLNAFSLFLSTFGYALVHFSRTKPHVESTLTISDIIDGLSPYFCIGCYVWIYFKSRERDIVAFLTKQKNRVSYLRFEVLLFIIFIIAWANGHGMHLSANSVHNVLDREYFSHKNENAGHFKEILVHLHHSIDLWDEEIGHIIWHVGIMGIHGVLIWSGQGHTIHSTADVLQMAVGSIFYSLSFFMSIIEGGTPEYGIPFLIISTAVMFSLNSWRKIRRCAVLFYCLCTNVTTLFACAVWGYMTDWRFPEFSEMGLVFSKQ